MVPKMSEKGFTLVELLIAMAASLIVLGAICGTFIVQNKSYEQQAQIIEMQENSRAGIQMMTREIMMAGYDPTGNAGAGIVAASANSIQFTMDLDGDQNVTGSNENVTYALDTTDNQLTRKGTAGGNADPLAENIPAGGLVFRYYDSGNTELLPSPFLSLADMAAVRRITIQLTARTKKPDPDYGGYRTRTLTSDVTPRNLGL